MRYKCCLCQKSKHPSKGKKRNCVQCSETTHWWCHSCASKNYREKKLNETAESVDNTVILKIENIFFGKNKKRGRPKKLDSDLHQKKKKKKFNASIKSLVDEVDRINQHSSSNNWGLSVGGFLKVQMDLQEIRHLSINPQGDSLENKQSLLMKLGYLKIRHHISNETLTSLLSCQRGINFPIKAHVVFEFLKEVKTSLLTKVSINCGNFSNGKKWSVFNITELLTYILVHVSPYNQLTSPVLNSSSF